MAASSLLALIDDISSVLDDVSVLTKLAAKKTAGVLGDDLALNAQQVSGVKAERELPVVWAVAKGSLLNKAILVPAALLISAFAPWGITALLMVGGAFLCYEGFEKLAHKWLHDGLEDQARHARHIEALAREDVDVASLEKGKIKGAVRTDFVLSAEIIAITLGAVAEAPFSTQVMVLVGIALVMTIGVYGLVAGIVKLDDAGLYLSCRPGRFERSLGKGILRAAPYMMKTLSIAGTAAMFMVGGGILTHGIPVAHAFIEELAHHAGEIHGALGAVAPTVMNAVAGVIAGAIVVGVVSVGRRMFRKSAAPAETSGIR
jgi:predicted DNA repair protein MutK